MPVSTDSFDTKGTTVQVSLYLNAIIRQANFNLV